MSLTSYHQRYFTKSKAKLAQKILNLIKDTPDSLAVICDFDDTLTLPKGYTSWCVVERSKLLSESYRDDCYKLYQKFQPLSTDPTLPMDIKAKYMEQWNDEAVGRLVDERILLHTVKDMLEEGIDQVLLREGVLAMIKTCLTKNTPFVIFSAGIGDVIDACIEYHLPEDAKNLYIVANRFSIDKEGYISGFSHEPIHISNKNEHTLRNNSDDMLTSSFLAHQAVKAHNIAEDNAVLSPTVLSKPRLTDVLSTRKNAIVMGDNVGDAAIYLDEPNRTVLRIGFLNKDLETEEKLKEMIKVYCDKFDVVMYKEDHVGYGGSIVDVIINACTTEDCIQTHISNTFSPFLIPKEFRSLTDSDDDILINKPKDDFISNVLASIEEIEQ